MLTSAAVWFVTPESAEDSFFELGRRLFVKLLAGFYRQILIGMGAMRVFVGIAKHYRFPR